MNIWSNAPFTNGTAHVSEYLEVLKFKVQTPTVKASNVHCSHGEAQAHRQQALRVPLPTNMQ